MRTLKPGQSGFSLIELAVVLMIVGILSGGILVAVSQVTEGNRRSTALAQLRMVEEALYGFAQVAGRLPCPASETSNGFESVPPSGVCDLHHGFVPSGTLGLAGAVNSVGQLLDPWQNPLRYAVERSNTFTQKDKLATAFNGSPITAGLQVCNAAGCPLPESSIASNIPAIIFTMGANWATYTSDDERQNAENNEVFVNTTYSEDNFDDQLLWLSPYVLFTRMVNAGRLP